MLTRLDEVAFLRSSDDCAATDPMEAAPAPSMPEPSMAAGPTQVVGSDPRFCHLGSALDRTTILFAQNRRPAAAATEQALRQQGFAVVVAGSLASARRILTDPGVRVDVVLIERNLPDGCADELLSELEDLPRQPGIVILTDDADDFCPEAVMFRAVVVPTVTSPTVLGNILKVAAEDYAAHTLRRFSKRYKLSRKETAILGRLADGGSPKSIATEANCSLQTIYFCLNRICQRTSCERYPEVVAKLFQFSCHGLGHAMSKGALRMRRKTAQSQ
jgi:DNA-binding NarL/FixJ family response regulator